MSKQDSSKQRRREYLQSVRVAGAMLDGPRTLDEISENFYSYLRIFGLFQMTESRAGAQTASISEELEALLALSWVVRKGERYALTPLGREEVEKRLSELGETGTVMRQFLQPEAVSKVTLGVHFGLAALMLPAGFLSGSVGLLNDAVDTFLDGISSLLVYLGLRFDKERAVNIVLVVFMLGTGALTFYEAVRRFFVPYEPEVDWFTFLVVLVSAVFCLGLWAYQRYVGLRSGYLSLITQSVDSRNHVIVAASVTAGLVASLLQFPMLDTLVGLAVALLILKSAVDLAVEIIRSMGEEGVDLSRYEFGLAGQYEKFRQAQLRDWMLYLVENQGVETQAELVARARQALDFNRIPAVQAMGLAQQELQADEMIERSIGELFDNGWLTGEQHLVLSPQGREHLRQRM